MFRSQNSSHCRVLNCPDPLGRGKIEGFNGFSQITKNTGQILAKAKKKKFFVPDLKNRGY